MARRRLDAHLQRDADDGERLYSAVTQDELERRPDKGGHRDFVENRFARPWSDIGDELRLRRIGREGYMNRVGAPLLFCDRVTTSLIRNPMIVQQLTRGRQSPPGWRDDSPARQVASATLTTNACGNTVDLKTGLTLPVVTSDNTQPSASGKRILVVDDEPDIVALIAFHVARAGYRVSTAANGRQALQALREEQPVLVILDLMLPDMSGYDVLEAMRREPDTTNTAVLMLTARKEEEDRVRGLSLGADDYVTKPFSPRELVLRVGAILKRARADQTPEDVISVGTLHINRATHAVTVEGKAVELTPTEYKLLVMLAERRGRVQARARLLADVWEAAHDVQTRTVDMHVQRLRSKLGPAGDVIETVRGFGYRIRAAPREAGASWRERDYE